jgi:hypothetical protein
MEKKPEKQKTFLDYALEMLEGFRKHRADTRFRGPTEIEEESCKFQAQVMLSEFSRDNRRIIVPTTEEWVGIHLLERDDELKRTTR